MPNFISVSDHIDHCTRTWSMLYSESYNKGGLISQRRIMRLDMNLVGDYRVFSSGELIYAGRDVQLALDAYNQVLQENTQ